MRTSVSEIIDSDFTIVIVLQINNWSRNSREKGRT